MRRLLKKGVPFKWTAECQSELDYLKKCLVSDPIVKPFDSNRDIIINIDGSSHGLQFSVLQCDDDNNLHAVRYGSYATTPHQANNSADDLEAVALMYALKSIESVALLRHVTIITDNSHVLHIKDWTPMNNRQRRTLTYILQFNLTILFIKGSRNLLADALSRMHQDSTVQERAEHQATFMHETDDFVLPVTTRTALTGDKDVQRARRISGSLDAPHEPTRPDSRGANGPDEQTSNLVPGSAADGDKSFDTHTDADGPTNGGDGTDRLLGPPTATNNDESPVTFPVISSHDYETDTKFVNMYKYLTTEKLTGNARADKTTLIMVDRYMIQNDLLYRIDLPRQKKLADLRPVTKRLCVPRHFRHEIIRYVHNNCGHYATQSYFTRWL